MANSKRHRPEGIAEFWDIKSVAEYLGVHRSTIDRMSQAGKMPRPFKFPHGKRLFRWRSKEVIEWASNLSRRID